MAASQARAKRQQPVADVHDSATDTTSGRGEGEVVEESAHEDSCSQMMGETSVKRKRSKHLSCYGVSNIIIEKKMKNRTELLHSRMPKSLKEKRK